MLIAYLDEPERNGLYHVGAAVAEMETWERIESSLEDFKLSIVNLYGLPSSELKLELVLRPPLLSRRYLPMTK